MLQKRNDLEIVEQLRTGPKHIRQLAQNLQLIPSTVMRLLSRLEEERVVDFELTGKNKTYHLKTTVETIQYIYLAEHYKYLQIMQDSTLRRILTEITQQTTAELIVLFGSYAKGTQTKHSDIDIYIKTTDSGLKKRLQQISEKLSIQTGNLDKTQALTQEIQRHHVIIRGVEVFYQDLK